jgi:hypothetical protein
MGKMQVEKRRNCSVAREEEGLIHEEGKQASSSRVSWGNALDFLCRPTDMGWSTTFYPRRGGPCGQETGERRSSTYSVHRA